MKIKKILVVLGLIVLILISGCSNSDVVEFEYDNDSNCYIATNYNTDEQGNYNWVGEDNKCYSKKYVEFMVSEDKARLIE
jgi:uncharacterized protein YceK